MGSSYRRGRSLLLLTVVVTVVTATPAAAQELPLVGDQATAAQAAPNATAPQTTPPAQTTPTPSQDPAAGAAQTPTEDSDADAAGAGTGTDRDCADFQTQAEAQEYFDSQGGSPTNNVDNLDEDADGVPCENLIGNPVGGVDAGVRAGAPEVTSGEAGVTAPLVLAAALLASAWLVAWLRRQPS